MHTWTCRAMVALAPFLFDAHYALLAARHDVNHKIPAEHSNGRATSETMLHVEVGFFSIMHLARLFAEFFGNLNHNRLLQNTGEVLAPHLLTAVWRTQGGVGSQVDALHSNSISQLCKPQHSTFDWPMLSPRSVINNIQRTRECPRVGRHDVRSGR